MAAYLQWRRFVFFDKEPVRLPGEGGNPLTLPPGLTVCDSGRGSLLFGDILSVSLLRVSAYIRVWLLWNYNPQHALVSGGSACWRLWFPSSRRMTGVIHAFPLCGPQTRLATQALDWWHCGWHHPIGRGICAVMEEH